MNKTVKRQARRAVGDTSGAGGGSLFTEPVLVVNQKASVFGGSAGYAVFNQHGKQLGMVEQVSRATERKTDGIRLGGPDDGTEYEFRVLDMEHRVLLAMTRPANWRSGKSKMIVEDPSGVAIGHITQETYGISGSMVTLAHTALSNASALAGAGIGLIAGARIGDFVGKSAGKTVGWAAGKTAKYVAGASASTVLGVTGAADLVTSSAEGLDKIGHVRFGLEAAGERLGSIHAEDSDEWDFRIQDTTGAEFARITKTWDGWARRRFTKADNYIVQMHLPLEEPLLSLVIAAALAIDVALKKG